MHTSFLLRIHLPKLCHTGKKKRGRKGKKIEVGKHKTVSHGPEKRGRVISTSQKLRNFSKLKSNGDWIGGYRWRKEARANKKLKEKQKKFMQEKNTTKIKLILEILQPKSQQMQIRGRISGNAIREMNVRNCIQQEVDYPTLSNWVTEIGIACLEDTCCECQDWAAKQNRGWNNSNPPWGQLQNRKGSRRLQCFFWLKRSTYLFGVELVNKKLKANMGPKK